MVRHVSETTAEELATIAERAARQAITEAHAAGVAVSGYAHKPNGETWRARLHPDGKYEWIEPVPVTQSR